jgi:hypothetical protein
MTQWSGARIARTREFYGSGGHAFRRIAVSRDAYRQIRSAGIGPLWFAPLLPEDDAVSAPAPGKRGTCGAG